MAYGMISYQLRLVYSPWTHDEVEPWKGSSIAGAAGESPQFQIHQMFVLRT